ncbi:urease accessory protein [Rhizobiales bacterium GAS188]|nr:urease accessory protein [Rhizobiales bacterium GAS188]
MRTDQLLALLAWLSPAFPVGAFAYSHGLEWAVERGDVRDASTLLAWIEDLMQHGAIRSDLVLASCAARAFEAGDEEGFREVAELALCLSPSKERHLETAQQGRSFIDTLCAAWPNPKLKDVVDAKGQILRQIAYPVAFGASVAAHALKLRPSLAAYAQQFAANLVSAVLRLGAVGQTDGQRVIARLAKAAERAAARAQAANLDDLGGAAFRSDIASLRHETQYSRLFRS